MKSIWNRLVRLWQLSGRETIRTRIVKGQLLAEPAAPQECDCAMCKAVAKQGTTGDTLRFNSPDSPSANGRKPQQGEPLLEVWMVDDQGRKIILVMGKQTWERHTELVIDSVAKRPVPKDFRRNFPN